MREKKAPERAEVVVVVVGSPGQVSGTRAWNGRVDGAG